MEVHIHDTIPNHMVVVMRNPGEVGVGRVVGGGDGGRGWEGGGAGGIMAFAWGHGPMSSWAHGWPTSWGLMACPMGQAQGSRVSVTQATL